MATEITYSYPIPGVADLQARLMLAGTAVTDWVVATAYTIETIHAGYLATFADVGGAEVEADAVQWVSVAEELAAEIALTSGGGSGSGLTPEQVTELLRAAGLIQTPVNPAAPQVEDGGLITIHRGDTFATTIELDADATGYEKLWLTLKRDVKHTDEQAVLMFVADEGLTRLNGATTTAENGAITLAGNGTSLSVALSKTASKELVPTNTGGGIWDVQMLKDGETLTVKRNGTYKVTADVTQAVS